MSETSFRQFVELIEALRAPGGCPWDAEQTHASIARNMVEEAYEAVHAIETNDIAALREELGDVLLQVVFQAQIASDEGAFTIDDVIAGIHSKIVRRHPHVFGDEVIADAAETLAMWDKIKQQEKAEAKKGLLHGVPSGQPALMRAQDISRKAVSVGFEWDTVDDIVEKLEEEIAEFRAAKPGSPHAEEELGDILFTAVNLGRKQGIDAETALRRACDKFQRRWADMELTADQKGRAIHEYDIDELEALWMLAKNKETKHE